MNKMKFLIIISLIFSTNSMANKKERIIYEYKKYEKFDMDDLVVEGESGSPGDLSIDPRIKSKFKNRLPYRKNFNKEIRKSIYRIR